MARFIRVIHTHRWLVLILALAFVLRLGYAMAQDHDDAYLLKGGDSGWYLLTGYELITGQDAAPISPAPVYLLFIGFWQAVLSRTAAAIIVIRLIQVIMSTATCFFGFRLAHALTGNQRAGLLAAGVQAVSLAFVVEAAQILTETLYIFLVAGGLWLYVDYVVPHEQANKTLFAALVGTGLVFGLATLTRAVLLLFPLGLAVHLVLLRGGRTGFKQAALLLIVYCLIVSTWTIYNLARWDRLVIGADGLASFVYMGARGWDSPQELDAALEEDVPEMTTGESTSPDRSDHFLTGARRAIGDDPLGYARRRIGELARAYVQPHGTVIFPGESLKELARDWFTNDRTLTGLLDLVTGDAFLPKLVIYVFHLAGLILGAVGIWLYRRAWRVALPLTGFILYTTLVHLVLMATPRYIFPVELCWWVFAAAALARWWDTRQANRRLSAG